MAGWVASTYLQVTVFNQTTTKRTHPYDYIAVWQEMREHHRIRSYCSKELWQQSRRARADSPPMSQDETTTPLPSLESHHNRKRWKHHTNLRLLCGTKLESLHHLDYNTWHTAIRDAYTISQVDWILALDSTPPSATDCSTAVKFRSAFCMMMQNQYERNYTMSCQSDA